jgi:hypothetical protein
MIDPPFARVDRLQAVRPVSSDRRLARRGQFPISSRAAGRRNAIGAGRTFLVQVAAADRRSGSVVSVAPEPRD